MSASVTDNPERHRFELRVGDAVAFATYRLERDRVVVTHTEVPSALNGQGIGSRLARGVLDLVRGSGRRLVPECEFMAAFAQRHPEYADIVDA